MASSNKAVIKSSFDNNKYDDLPWKVAQYCTCNTFSETY